MFNGTTHHKGLNWVSFFLKMNRTRWIIALWSLLGVSTLIQLTVMRVLYPESITVTEVFVFPLGSFVIGILLLFMYLIPLFDYCAKFKVRKRLFLLALFGVVYVLLYVLMVVCVYALFIAGSFEDYRDAFTGFILSNFNHTLKNYLFQIAIIYAYEFVHNLREEITRKKDLEIKLGVSKLQLLRSQLQPHFLFNSLNSVVSIIDENKLKAQEMLINLSDFLRITLNSDFKKLITLKEELENVRKYLSIEKIRFEDQLEYSISIDEEASKLLVPSFILQPIVENAIKHGFQGMSGKLIILIEVNDKDKVILVKNNGKALTDTLENHGLANVRKRLELYNPNGPVLRLYQSEDWVINEVPIR